MNLIIKETTNLISIQLYGVRIQKSQTSNFIKYQKWSATQSENFETETPGGRIAPN